MYVHMIGRWFDRMDYCMYPYPYPYPLIICNVLYHTSTDMRYDAYS